MRATKVSTLPAHSSATALAASLPERIIRPYNRSSMVICSPSYTGTSELSLGTSAAQAGMVISSSSPPRSKASSRVMILVVLAG